MKAGFALLEAGSVRAKNTTNILMKNIIDTGNSSPLPSILLLHYYRIIIIIIIWKVNMKEEKRGRRRINEQTMLYDSLLEFYILGDGICILFWEHGEWIHRCHQILLDKHASKGISNVLLQPGVCKRFWNNSQRSPCREVCDVGLFDIFHRDDRVYISCCSTLGFQPFWLALRPRLSCLLLSLLYFSNL